MYLNNSQRPKKEYSPRNWKETAPFRKSTKLPLPTYSEEELNLLSKYFDDSVRNGLEIQSAIGATLVVGTYTFSITGRIQSSTSNPITPRDRIDYDNFKDTPSFHRLLRKDPSMVIPFRVPFKNLPLHIGKNVWPRYYPSWYSSVVSWRLQIGK